MTSNQQVLKGAVQQTHNDCLLVIGTADQIRGTKSKLSQWYHRERTNLKKSKKQLNLVSNCNELTHAFHLISRGMRESCSVYTAINHN